MEATRNALQRHLESICSAATASDGPSFNQFRVDWPDDHGKVLIVVPTRDRVDLLKPCVDSILTTAAPEEFQLVIIDHKSTDTQTVEYLASLDGIATVMTYKGSFNYSDMNNVAVKTYGGDCRYVLLLNNDVEALEKGWLERMRSLAGRLDVGAVGATLLYPDQTIQHSGVILGLNGPADHAHKFKPFLRSTGDRDPGYLGSLSSVREWSAVTAACLMMRTELFLALGGLNVALAVGFNDTDLCLRIRAAGFKVLVDSFAVLLHKESATRANTGDIAHSADNVLFNSRWQDLLKSGDLFYNPTLSLTGVDHEIAEARGYADVVRVTRVILPTWPRGETITGPLPKTNALTVSAVASDSKTKKLRTAARER